MKNFCKHFLLYLFVMNKLRFLSQNFLVRKRWVHKRLLLREYTWVVNNPSSTKLATVNWKMPYAVLNPSKSFLTLKKVSPRILSTFKRSFSKKMAKTPSSHIIHSLGGEYCWIVRDSEPIRLLKSPGSLRVYILIRVIVIFFLSIVDSNTCLTFDKIRTIRARITCNNARNLDLRYLKGY